ncbi:MAG: OprO/OprP family phosphate-selective porin [Flavobacteriales bacterium]|jgi:phosphate-selective porin|nr:OprO/OprP family phosphate-selective porin [Flavobacteriales bacterium]
MNKKLIFAIILLVSHFSWAQNFQPTAKFGGRIIVDGAWLYSTDTSKVASQSNLGFRQVRLKASGKLHSHWNYVVQFGFIKSKVIYRNVYIENTKIPFFGKIKIGSIVNPYRLDVLNNALNMTFIERSFNDRLSPKWTIGIMIYDELIKHEKLNYAFSFSKDDPKGYVNNLDQDYHVTARLSSVFHRTQHALWHADIALNHRKMPENTWEYTGGVEQFFMNKHFRSSKSIDVNHVNTFNIGLLGIYKRWSFQSEFTHIAVKKQQNDDQLNMVYLQASYFLTPDKKSYAHTLSPLGKTTPSSKRGAWEIGIRSNYIKNTLTNLSELNHTLALNWHIDTQTRLAFNYIHLTQNGKSIGHLLGLRTQIRF